MSIIKVSDLTFCYEGSYDNIFENVSFQLDTDWRLGLTGRNGRGKTTLLRLLEGRYPYQGTIHASVGFDYFPFDVPDAAQFSSPELRHIYTVLLAHGGTGTVQIAALSGELTPDELALLTGIIQQPAELSNGARALDDYISILQTQSSAGAAVSEADLLAFANKLKEHKGYGGKDGTERHE